MGNQTVLYRAVAKRNSWAKFNENTMRVYFEIYQIIKVTPTGAVISTELGNRFVSSRGNKIFARAKKKDAVNDLRHRYRRREKIFTAQLETTKLLLETLAL